VVSVYQEVAERQSAENPKEAFTGTLVAASIVTAVS
jgi:hypothetical protein